MAGDWIKMETSTPDKPEVLAITVHMGWDDPDLTVGKLFRAWRWFDQHSIDGNATGVTTALLDRIVGVTGFASAMQCVGWLIVTESGLTLPGFEKHCGKTAKGRAQTAKRVAIHKKKVLGNGDRVTGALPREEKRRSKEHLSGEPDVEAGLLTYLNAQTGKAFQPVYANLNLLKARLKETSAEQIRAVIDSKVAQWKGDSKMDEFLRPATLFAATNFAQYLGQLGSVNGSRSTFAGAK